MPVNPQTLNINNLRTTNGKSINLHTIRKLIEYSLKMFCKIFLYWTFSYTHTHTKENIICCSETRWIDFQNQLKEKKSMKIKLNQNQRK